MGGEGGQGGQGRDLECGSANQGADFMRPMMEGKANDIRCSGIEDSGHFVAERVK